ncbi:MAG: hypothetical protein R3D58_13105 [Saprospiraceae bacterium]
MSDNSLTINTGTETSVSAEQLTTWLKDLDKYGDSLLIAIREGRAKVTTTAGFSEFAGRLRSLTDKYAAETLRSSQLTTEKVVLTNTIFYLLKSCEGIALNAEKIGELISVLPIGEGMDAKTIASLLLDSKKRDLIFTNAKILTGAFDAQWLAKIEVIALAAILEETGIDFSAYANLVEVLKKQIPATTPDNG